ncbi:saccharopine dehydrogenase [Paractinoplanes deccanensis]|uniref:Saccharopine dehydrogenase n=1 Tax=Paractinoplanes deccanensis TaxID=113561 RepID=A0ABQ3Y8C3_9ACTN|nr:saccharopine dehydrogenase NADP-binding domain-containing protein [Actinoplanes deccanensis]GID76110.1 saccharopine dehydrogenase [Actinoplanes deccanensis]
MNIAVFGAYGHTGRFVVAELRERGLVPLPLGRDGAKLAAAFPDLAHRVAALDDLDLSGADAVINTAGPFASTAGPVIEAALRAGIPYVDVAAEIEANADTLARAKPAHHAVVPAMAFFGGLGDLLVTAAMGDWDTAGEAHIAYGLSGWHPTAGTLAAGAVSHERRGGRRVRYTGGRLDYYDADGDLPTLDWDFPGGRRTVLAGFSMADIVTVPSHLDIPEVRSYMTVEAARGLAGRATGERVPETFTVDAIVRRDGAERRATVHGRDIYAVSAPLAVEAVQRILDGRTRTTGVASAGKMFDAEDFLRALPLEYEGAAGPVGGPAAP